MRRATRSKRPKTAKPGWDNKVLAQMQEKVTARLRDYWDAGIRGPDFVWAATGPALEAYSQHPVVKKANASSGEVLSVSEFLRQVRRMVVDFVVGQVLSGEGSREADWAAADQMDAPTAYYLLHRRDFGLEEAPVGACILYATACGLSDSELEGTWDMVSSSGASVSLAEDEYEEQDEDSDRDGRATEGEDSDRDGRATEGEDSDRDGRATEGGGKLKLKPWNRRKGKRLGYEAPGGRPVPLIDRVHRLMHLWKAGDVHKVDEFLDDHALRRNELFKRLLQSLIELSTNSERATLESISNHLGAKGASPEDRHGRLNLGDDE